MRPPLRPWHERLFRIDHPFGIAQRLEKGGEGSAFGKADMIAEEFEAAISVRRDQHLKEQPADEAIFARQPQRSHIALPLQCPVNTSVCSGRTSAWIRRIAA